MKLSSNARFARNVVIGMGVFLLLGGVWMLIIQPTKWQDHLSIFSGSALAFFIVREVNRGEGEWAQEIIIRRSNSALQTTDYPDPSEGSEKRKGT
ncbi:MAG TPA: hypothetical protein VFB38_24905 [Chthonomonadaceae bacterium]|nr:hypothetical protein [Chthonomonadaceae bacterium]